jgi:hypothetical protein
MTRVRTGRQSERAMLIVNQVNEDERSNSPKTDPDHVKSSRAEGIRQRDQSGSQRFNRIICASFTVESRPEKEREREGRNQMTIQFE